MKYKITIEKIFQRDEYNKYAEKNELVTHTEEIYSQTTENEIDLKSIIDAFNKQTVDMSAPGGGGGNDE